MAFDVGSSGIRIGSTLDSAQTKVAIDYLADVDPDNEINVTVEKTIETLVSLPVETGIPKGCRGVAAGFSAWRLAWRKGKPDNLLATLKNIHQQTQVEFFIIPQDVEAVYGYISAKAALGAAIPTPFVLDLGGGSLQIASANIGWGTELGQKTWRKSLCREINNDPDPLCSVNPIGAAGVQKAAKIVLPETTAAQKILGSGIGLTAVSAPVVKGIHPVLSFLAGDRRLILGAIDNHSFSRDILSHAIELLSTKSDEAIASLLENCHENTSHPFCATRFIPTLVTDMLLVHAFMTGLAVEHMEVSSAEVTNVAGILADERGFAWAGHYNCYLDQLKKTGLDAFKSDPRSVCTASDFSQP